MGSRTSSDRPSGPSVPSGPRRGDAGRLRPATGTIPTTAGVYRFRAADGTVVYVGKAINLRSRLSNYFADPDTLHPRTAAMVRAATDVDWVTVSNEVEALQLEYSWIKEYEPRFNVRYRDDKSYPYLAITMNEEYPRVLVMRGAKRKGVRYFGPYAHAWAIRDTVDQLLRAFPMRSCGAGVFRRHALLDRPCLLGDIGKCSAPCVGRVSAAEHRAIAADMCAFLEGRTDRFVRRVEAQMAAAAAVQDYERAARLRDDLAALRRALERTAMVLGENTDADVIAVAHDDLDTAVQIFHVRGGRVRGQRDFVVERPPELTVEELLEQLLIHVYGGLTGVELPREVLVQQRPARDEVVARWLGQLRGSRVAVKVPTRGPKRDLLATAADNAGQTLVTHKLKRGADLVSRGRALEQLAVELGLPEAPLRIECIDISSHAGQDVVASVVVFEDALPRPPEYRRYVITDASDDVGSMRAAVLRRYRERAERSRYRPGLLLVDGGLPQANAAAAALAEVGANEIPVRGLAKRLEEVYRPGDADSIVLSRRSEALYLLQRVRDEAHRVAITHHRSRRKQRSRAGALDGIAGLGPTRKALLLKRFGSVRALRAASPQDLLAVPGIGPQLAATVVAGLAGNPESVAINMATGEIVDHAGPRD